jgi:hypothetical protein
MEAELTIPDAPPATGLFPQDIDIEEIRRAIHGFDLYPDLKMIYFYLLKLF